MTKTDNGWETVSGGVTAVPGFLASGIAAAVKYKDKKDIALIYSTVPATAAGVFTINKVKAAPVLVNMRRVAGGKAQAVVVNSGNANACNGEQGMTDALTMARTAAEALGISEDYVLVGSTGVIGQPMPMDRVIPGIKSAVAALSEQGGQDAAEAIMTTDTVLKQVALRLTLGGKQVTVGGMAKGSGMIHPNMATMLCFITTDAAVSAEMFSQALRYAVDRSFNMITVDGDTSTNDMVLALANGKAGNPEITGQNEDYQLLRDALLEVCTQLAVSVARDGEGATKLIEVKVVNAPSEKDAQLAAKAVAASSLVKAAFFGEDANWGRILCAAGYSGADFDPDQVDIFLGDEQVARDGCALPFNEEKAAQILAANTVTVLVNMKSGSGEATAWGCDLTYDYVKINGDYRT